MKKSSRVIGERVNRRVEEVWDPELGRHVFRTVEYVEKVVETEVYFSTLCVLYDFFYIMYQRFGSQKHRLILFLSLFLYFFERNVFELKSCSAKGFLNYSNNCFHHFGKDLLSYF